MFDAIAFDADDTLWHTEGLYADAQARFRDLLSRYHEPAWIDERLYHAEVRNLPHFGYGIKGFALSMIETAVELTEGRIGARDIQVIIDMAKEMLAAKVVLLDHVTQTVASLAATHRLLVITKGDLRDQQKKIDLSGLAGHFRHVEIVSDKDPATYTAILMRHAIEPARFLFVGNSLRSDILPVLAVGAHAVYVPYALTWSHEVADPPPADHPRFHQIRHLGELPALVARLEGR